MVKFVNTTPLCSRIFWGVGGMNMGRVGMGGDGWERG